MSIVQENKQVSPYDIYMKKLMESQNLEFNKEYLAIFPRDEYGNTPYGHIIVKGKIIKPEPITFNNGKIYHPSNIFEVIEPESFKRRWDSIKFDDYTFILPFELEINLKAAYITNVAWQKIFKYILTFNETKKDMFTEFKYSNNYIYGSTWYSKGKKLLTNDTEEYIYDYSIQNKLVPISPDE